MLDALAFRGPFSRIREAAGSHPSFLGLIDNNVSLPGGVSGVQSAVLKVLVPHRNTDTIGAQFAKKCVVTLGAQLASTIRVSPSWLGHLSESLNQVKAYVRLCWLKTVAGGWCTTYRMHEDVKWPCVFGCCDSKDDLQHYLICPALWQYPLPFVGVIDSIFIGERLCLSDPSIRKLRAIAIVHAVYHSCKNHPECSSAIRSHVQGTFDGHSAFALVQHRALGFARTAATLV